jgi:regulatory protein
MRKQLIITPEIALNKMRKWCAYQERSQFDARNKLIEFRIETAVRENIISTLIEENFLNEERFAIALARGKLRIKSWGKIKIKAALRKHKVSDYCIEKALKELNFNEYQSTIDKLINKENDKQLKQEKQEVFYALLRKLIAKGFEKDLVIERLNVILEID